MKTRNLLLGIFIFTFSVSKAQIIKVSNGIGISKFAAKGQSYDKSVSAYVFSIGLAYLSTDYYELMTELGCYQKGGVKDIQVNGENEIISKNIESRLNYLHFNTIIRGKLPIRHFSVFAGIGPKVDFILKSKTNVSRIYIQDSPFDLDRSRLHKTIWGIKPEIGILREFNRIRLELSGSYIVDIGKIDNQNNNFRGNTFVCMLSVGYNFY